MRKEFEDLVEGLRPLAQTIGSKSDNHPDSKAFTDPKNFAQNLRNMFNEINSISNIETLVLDVNKGDKGTTYSILTATDQQKIKTEGVNAFDEVIEKKEGSKEKREDLVIFRKQALLYVIAALAGIEDIDAMLKEENTKEALTVNYRVLARFLEEQTPNKRLTVLSNFLNENEKYITGHKQTKQIEIEDDPEKRVGRRVKFAEDVTIFRYEDTSDESINPNANKETINAKSWEDQQLKGREEFNPTGKDVFTAAREGTLNIGDPNAPVTERTVKELREMHRDRRASRRNISIGTMNTDSVDRKSSGQTTDPKVDMSPSVDNAPPPKTTQSGDNTPPPKKELPRHRRNTSIVDFTSTIGNSKENVKSSEKLSNSPTTSETKKSTDQSTNQPSTGPKK